MDDSLVDKWLAWCEDRYMRSIEEDEFEQEQFLDEYGREPNHPDYGYNGPSIDICTNCDWRGDAWEYRYSCPNCGSLTYTEY